MSFTMRRPTPDLRTTGRLQDGAPAQHSSRPGWWEAWVASWAPLWPHTRHGHYKPVPLQC